MYALHAGDLVGLPVADPVGAARTMAVVVSDDALLYGLPRRRLLDAMATDPALAARVYGQVERRLAELYDRVKELAVGDAAMRLARTLVRLAHGAEPPVVPATHAELAAWVGTSRERVTKLLAPWRVQGLIATPEHGRGIVLRDPAALAAYRSTRSRQ